MLDDLPLFIYGGKPPFVASSDTSRAAAQSIDAASVRGQVLEAIASQVAGATCDEIEAQLDMRHQTASARIRELVLLKRIVDSGDRRPTRSGRNAAVYVLHSEV